jgi:copper chaperone CopZ
MLCALTACGGGQPAVNPPVAPAAAISAPESAPSAPESAAQDFGEGGYVLEVLGMSCPKCISNIDLQLARIHGVGGVQIDMKHGTVALTIAPGVRVTREALNDAVEDAGFTLGGVRAVVPPPAAP